MKILLVHNYYQQGGGEDSVFRADLSLLREHGHDVLEYIDDNDRIRQMNPVSVGVQTIWSRQTYTKIFTLLQAEKPDLVQFYNIFPLISPSAYYACRAFRIPVVQYLFNPRLICPSANLYRDGNLCMKCVGKTPPMSSIIHGCYRNSRLQTAGVASMLTFHRLIKTWDSAVDIYLSATEFYKGVYIKGGLPADKIWVKPNYIRYDPSYKPESLRGDYALFVGRLDPEKGIRTLMNAWKSLDIPLVIRGSGQLEQEVLRFIDANHLHNIRVAGLLDEEGLYQLRQYARFLVWSSEGYYETFGMAAVECYAQGIPVIASNIGVMKEIVRDGKTGLHFQVGNPQDLAEKVRWAWEHPHEMDELGRNARAEYEEKYTADLNYEALIDIYNRLLSKSGL